MSRVELSREIAEAINDLIADHPMWIGADGEPLDYLPEREARIADFVNTAAEDVAQVLASRLAAIEALAEKWASWNLGGKANMWSPNAAAEIRAALAGEVSA